MSAFAVLPVAGTARGHVPMVRCHLDGADDDPSRALRFIPAAEFDLWQYLMRSRHGRVVTVDEVSVWIPDGSEEWDPDIDAELLEPVLHIRFDKPGPGGVMVPVERYFAAETYPEAQAAVLAHFDPRCRWTIAATPGYFVPVACLRYLHSSPQI